MRFRIRFLNWFSVLAVFVTSCISFAQSTPSGGNSAAAPSNPAGGAAGANGVYNQAGQAASKSGDASKFNQAGSQLATLVAVQRFSANDQVGGYAAAGAAVVLSLLSGQNAKEQGQAYALQNKVATTNPGSGLTGDTGSTDPTGRGLNGLTPQQKAIVDGNLAAANAQLQKATALITSKGGSVNPNGVVTTPDGRTIDPNKMNPSDLASDGFSPDEIDNIMSAKNKIAADLKAANANAGNSFAADGISFGGGGGGGGSGGGKSPEKTGLDLASLFGKKAAPKARAAASIKGLSKKFGNDNIGVEGDNIFEMLNRRYDSEKSAGGFFPN